MKSGFICVVCGKVTSKPKGLMRHPICPKCYKKPKMKAKWLDSLKRDHPYDYPLFKKLDEEGK